MIRRAAIFLRSSRLAAVEIAVLVVFSLVTFVIPQKPIIPPEQFAAWQADAPTLARVAEAFGLDRIFQSVGFYALATLIAFSIIVCTLHRIGVRRNRAARRPRQAPSDALAITGDLDRAAAGFAAALPRWRATRSEGVVVFERGVAGFVGSIVLHAALVIIAIGGVVSGVTTFTGTMVLTEGQRLEDAPESYIEVSSLPRMGAGFRGFTVGLERLTFIYESGVVTDAVARMVVTEGDVERSEDVRVNYPLRVAGKSLRPLDAGYSTLLVVRDPDGGTTFDSFVNLGNRAAEGWYDTITAGALQVDALAVPDAAAEIGTDAVDMLDMRDPGVWITPTLAGVRGEMVMLRPGDFIKLPSGHEVAVLDVRRWNRFLVRSDSGLPIIYLGFVLALLGASMRFLNPDRYVAVLADQDGTVRVWSRVRRGGTASTEVAVRVAATLEHPEYEGV